MHIFATLHMPDPNPVGLPLIVTSATVGLFAGLTTWQIPPWKETGGSGLLGYEYVTDKSREVPGHCTYIHILLDSGSY